MAKGGRGKLRLEGAGGQLVRKRSRRKLLPSSDSDPPKSWAGRVLTEGVEAHIRANSTQSGRMEDRTGCQKTGH